MNMSPILLNLNEFLTICAFGISGGALLGYLLVAWNNTPLPVFLSQILARIFFRKKSMVHDLHSRNEWLVWSNLELPHKLAHWLNCPICQIPYLVVSLYAALYLCGAIGGVIAILSACLALKLALSTQHAAPVPPTIQSQRKPVFQDLEAKVPKRGGPILPDPAAADKSGHFVGTDPKPASKRREEQPETMEGVTEVAADAVTGKREALRQHADGLLGFQQAFGLKTKKADTGGFMIDPTSISPEMRQIVRFFVASDPCWFTGCESLRAEYNAELQTIGGEDCTSCQQGDLTRKYMLLIKERYPQALDGTPSPDSRP